MTIDIGFHRSDVHAPVNFQPESYTFVGCYHNTYSFHRGGKFNAVRDQLRGYLAQNKRPNGPGDSNCDHCGAAIAFVGVFQHVDGEYIAAGSTCAENRFPLSNKEFQRLRKEHRLSRDRDLKSERFEQFKLENPGVGWVDAEASDDVAVKSILRSGRKYGSLTNSQVRYLVRLLTHAPVVAPVAPPAPVSSEVAFLQAYQGDNSFLNSLKGQLEAGRTLSPKQLACVANNIARAAAPQVDVTVNQDIKPGCYIDVNEHVWQVKGNQAYVSGAKRARDAGVEHVPSGRERVYAKVWTNTDGSRVKLSEARDASQAQAWTYIPGGIQLLVIDHKMTLAEAKTFIEFYKECVRCGRHLEADASLERGIGPVCVNYFEGFENA